MLREETPKEKLEHAFGHFKSLGPVAYFASYAGMIVLYFLRGGEFDFKIMLLPLFLAVALNIGSFIASFIWLRLAAWLGHLNFSQTVDAVTDPDANPRSLERFLDAWWEHEGVLDAFHVVFSVAFCLGAYRLLGPKVGLL